MRTPSVPSHSGPSRRAKSAARQALAACAPLLGAVATLALARALEQDPVRDLAGRRAAIVEVVPQGRSTGPGWQEELVRVRAADGLAVELALRRPLDGATGNARRALVVLLGGHETGRRAVELVGDTRGVAVAALSYPYDGDPKARGLALLWEVPRLRRAIADTPAAIRLALDWLCEQPSIDPARIELAGVSLGAPFACIAGAQDDRVARVWSIHGAGDPATLIENGLRRKQRFAPLRSTIAELAWRLAGGRAIEPERWVGAIAPRRFVMLNASDDERLPRAAVDALYASAREPKEIVWIAGRHVSPRRAEIVRDLIDRVLERVVGPE